jgi:hypothetical protein
MSSYMSFVISRDSNEDNEASNDAPTKAIMQGREREAVGIEEGNM